jgi:hypothetical protein
LQSVFITKKGVVMAKRLTCVAVAFSSTLWLAAISPLAIAQQNGPIDRKTLAPDGKWDEIGDRLVFLMTRLVNVEAALEANDAAAAVQGAESNAHDGNTEPARATTVPNKWREFYELLATEFYYHPADRSSSYHTTAILDLSHAGENQVRAASPAKLPKVDDFAQAYHDAKADAEAAARKLTPGELKLRQRALEKEQAELWYQIAMRAIADRDFLAKSLYRFEPYSVVGGNKAVQQSQAAKAGGLFMQAAVAASTQTEREAQGNSMQAAQSLAEARERLVAALLKYWPEESVNDSKVPLGRLPVLSKRLVDTAGNLAESQKLAEADDQFANRHERDLFRATLQQSAVRYAEIVFALDETLGALASDFQIRSDKFTPLTLAAGANAGMPAKGGAGAGAAAKPANDWDTYEGADLKDAFDLGVRGFATGAGIEFTPGLLEQERSLATGRTSYKLPVEAEFAVVAYADACYDICPAIGGFSLRWGDNFNKNNYLYVNNATRFEGPHERIIPGEENLIKMRVDAAGHATVSINGHETFNRDTYVPANGEVKINLGGGIGHVEYRKVQIRSAPVDEKAVAPKAPPAKEVAVPAKANNDTPWKELAGANLRNEFELGARAIATSAGIELTAGELQEERSTATSKTAYKLPLEVEYTVVALPDSCLDVCPGFGDVELRWGDFWNKKTYLLATKDIRFEAPHVRITPGQENVIKMTADRNGQVTVSINGQPTFSQKTDLDPNAEAKIVLGGGIGHLEYRKVRIRSQ